MVLFSFYKLGKLGKVLVMKLFYNEIERKKRDITKNLNVK